MTNAEFNDSMRLRTKNASLRIIKLFQALPKTDEARIIGKQLLRCSTSVATNFRAACRGRSVAEYYAKLSIVIEEADETLFWMEMLIESEIIARVKLSELSNEYLELLKIFSSSRKTINLKKKGI